MSEDSIISPTTGARKNLPMIVDISIANDGRQIYQVHDSGEVSASKRSFDDLDGEIQCTPASATFDDPAAKMLKIDAYGSRAPSPTRAKMEDESEVWGPDVEASFEEALRIIPKNGLSKIKVSGRSCGRNELISDFIYQKTGKLRTRKQVSSHIQVIKNLKKNQMIIDLINNGPSDPDSLKKFEDVFSKITFQKSMGASTGLDLNINKKSKRRAGYNPKNICEVTVNGFEMQCGGAAISTLKSREFDTNLKLKANANISSRFPGLFELFSSNTGCGPIINNSIPSLHGMCKISLSSEFSQQSHATSGPNSKSHEKYNTHLDLSLKGLSVNESSWSVLTVIYSFGQEVVRLIDLVDINGSEVINGVKNVDLQLKFAPEFWDAFFTSLDNTPQDDDKHKDVAIRAITMKQIVFRTSDMPSGETGPANLLKKDIRSIILWEFLKVDEDVKAMTTLRRIHLINPTPQPSNTAVLQAQMAAASAAQMSRMRVQNNVIIAPPVTVNAPPTPMTPGYASNIAAPVAVNPMQQPYTQQLTPQQQQQMFLSPFTPSTTPISVQTCGSSTRLVGNLQKQEDLINRLESPINLMGNNNMSHHLNGPSAGNNDVYQFGNDVMSQFDFGFNGSEAPVPKKMYGQSPVDSMDLLQQIDSFSSSNAGATHNPSFDFGESKSSESYVSFNSEFSLASNHSNSTNASLYNTESADPNMNLYDFGFDVKQQQQYPTQATNSTEELIW